MHPFVQNLLSAGPNPIGVDFGSQTLRMAQVDRAGGQFRLVAAASADVPPEIANNAAERFHFFKQAVHDLLPRFQGRSAVICVPASQMSIAHVRLAADAANQPGSVQGAIHQLLQTDASSVLLRYLVAGSNEHQGHGMDEVIALTARRGFVDELLHHAALAKLDVIGMNVEPIAIVDCFSHVYRRRLDAEQTSLFVDVGATGTRVMAARGTRILFARSLCIGGNALNDAVATKLQITRARAAELRIANHSVCQESSTLPLGQNVVTEELREKIEQACRPVMENLIAELRKCRVDHEANFPNCPIERAIFVGGESSDSLLCQRLGGGVGVSAQVGNPMVRMGRATANQDEPGLDRRQPQPAWALAIGLSMGPASAGNQLAIHKVS